PPAAPPVQVPGCLHPPRRDPGNPRRQASPGRAPSHARSNPAHRTGVPCMTPAQDDAPSGRATDHGNAASTTEVRAMFDRIARVYDPMNLVISAFQEPRWRKRAVALTQASPGDRLLDVATGTGKVAADLHRRAQPGGSVLGVDISPAMIRVATRRFADRPGLEFVVGDALALPTENGTFDAASIAFGMRNLPDYAKGFAEMAR